jgi:hypothetical protein
MLGVYPLRPVITDDPLWKSVYDGHPDSVNLTSECITAGEARSLLDEGAVFEAVVLLNDAGEHLLDRLRPGDAEPVEPRMRIERVRIEAPGPDAVARIHDYLKDGPPSLFFQSDGG